MPHATAQVRLCGETWEDFPSLPQIALLPGVQTQDSPHFLDGKEMLLVVVPVLDDEF